MVQQEWEVNYGKEEKMGETGIRLPPECRKSAFGIGRNGDGQGIFSALIEDTVHV